MDLRRVEVSIEDRKTVSIGEQLTKLYSLLDLSDHLFQVPGQRHDSELLLVYLLNERSEVGKCFDKVFAGHQSGVGSEGQGR